MMGCRGGYLLMETRKLVGGEVLSELKIIRLAKG